jgi:hypothetical protein
MNMGELFENRMDIVELFADLMNHQPPDPLNEEANQKLRAAVEAYMGELYDGVLNDAAERYNRNAEDREAETAFTLALDKIVNCMKLIRMTELIVMHAGKGSCVITDTGEIRPYTPEPVA